MTEWRTVKLGDIAVPGKDGFATGPFGSAVSAKHFVSDGIAMIRGSNLSDDIGVRLDESEFAYIPEGIAATYKRSVVGSGDLVFTCWGTVGQIGIIDDRSRYDRYLISNKQMKMTPDPLLADSLFLYYCLSQPNMVDFVRSQSIGSSVPGFNLGQLKSLPVRLPRAGTQRAIAEVLSSLDDKIAANTELATTSSELARAKFVQLARRAGARVPLGDLVDVTKGVSYRSANLEPASSALLTLKCFQRDGGFSERGFKEYSGESKPAQVVKPGEVVVAQTDLTQAADVVGRAVRVPGGSGYDSLVASLDVAIVRPRTGLANETLLGMLQQDEFREHCRALTSGTTVLHLARGAIETYRAPVLDRVVSGRYAAEVLPLRLAVDAAWAESKILIRTRDALLPHLMSGKLRVRDAERIAEDPANAVEQLAEVGTRQAEAPSDGLW